MNRLNTFWYQLQAEKTKFRITWSLGVGASLVFFILTWSIKETFVDSVRAQIPLKPFTFFFFILISAEILLTIFTTLEITFFKSFQRRVSYNKVLLTKAVTSGSIILLTVSVSMFIYGQTHGLAKTDSVSALFKSPITWGLFVYWVSIADVNFLMLMVHNQTGLTIFSQYSKGRYYKPFEEERVFLFIDLIGSTPIAEKIGNRKYFELLNDVYYDISFPIGFYGAEIYQYVGDEVVMSWNINEGIDQNKCVRLFKAIQRIVDKNSVKYQGKFGVIPQFKGALHAGNVTTGEVGYYKTAILHSGDVVNTAARLEKLAGELHHNLIISEKLLNRLDKNELKLKPLGEHMLTGKEEKVNLFAVDLK
tara:strand:- start:3206 stop:4294 length:1089 start_codon:yes stop_codon:yes gene_type:complete